MAEGAGSGPTNWLGLGGVGAGVTALGSGPLGCAWLCSQALGP